MDLLALQSNLSGLSNALTTLQGVLAKPATVSVVPGKPPINVTPPGFQVIPGVDKGVSVDSIVTGIGNSLSGEFNAIVGGIDKLGGDITKQLEQGFINVGTNLSDFAGSINNTFGNVLSTLSNGLANVGSNISAQFYNVLNDLGTGFNDVKNSIITPLSQGFNSVVSDVQGVGSTIANTLSGGLQQVEQFISNIPQSVEQIGTNIANALGSVEKAITAAAKQQTPTPEVLTVNVDNIFNAIGNFFNAL